MMKTLVIDGHEVRTKEELYTRMRWELCLPDYFGNNLDALYDVLTESPEGISIEFTNYKELCAHLGDDFCTQLLRVLQDAEVCSVIKEDEQQGDQF